MINISPIKINNTKQNATADKHKNSAVFAQKADSFEFTTKIAFKGKEAEINLHFPLEETEKMFSSAYKEITSTEDLNKKIGLTFECVEKLQSILNKTRPQNSEELGHSRAAFVSDRAHEILNPTSELYYKICMIGVSKGKEAHISNKEYDHFCKYAFKRTLNTIKRYESFLDKGLESDKIKPNEVFQMALDSASEKAKHKNIKIKTIGKNVLKENKVGIFGPKDVGRLHDYSLYAIFSNLIQNSAKYSPENSTITAKFEKKCIDNKNYLVFSVSDHGIGIPKEQQKHALEGVRASNAIKSGIEGTGYGLNRVKKILDFADSNMTIESPLHSNNHHFPGSKISCFIHLKD